jgi:hypothetical protein
MTSPSSPTQSPVETGLAYFQAAVAQSDPSPSVVDDIRLVHEAGDLCFLNVWTTLHAAASLDDIKTIVRVAIYYLAASGRHHHGPLLTLPELNAIHQEASEVAHGRDPIRLLGLQLASRLYLIPIGIQMIDRIVQAHGNAAHVFIDYLAAILRLLDLGERLAHQTDEKHGEKPNAKNGT